MFRNSRTKELFLVLRISALAAVASVIAPAVEFGRDVQPLLADRCFACHGPDAAQRQAGLRLDIRSAALAPTASGRVPIQPGDPDGSEVLRRASSPDPVLRMPPAYMGHQPLAPEDLALLRRWIEEGAEYQTGPSSLRPSRSAPRHPHRIGRGQPWTRLCSPVWVQSDSLRPQKPPMPSGSAG